MYNTMMELFDPMRPFFGEPMRKRCGEHPHAGLRVDVRQTEDAYILDADLPGVEREDIHVDVNGDVLTIAAEVHAHKKEPVEGYLCDERHYRRAERSFRMKGVNAAEITADYRNGVLTLTLPKRQEERANTFRIPIGPGA